MSSTSIDFHVDTSPIPTSSDSLPTSLPMSQPHLSRNHSPSQSRHRFSVQGVDIHDDDELLSTRSESDLRQWSLPSSSSKATTKPHDRNHSRQHGHSLDSSSTDRRKDRSPCLHSNYGGRSRDSGSGFRDRSLTRASEHTSHSDNIPNDFSLSPQLRPLTLTRNKQQQSNDKSIAMPPSTTPISTPISTPNSLMSESPKSPPIDIASSVHPTAPLFSFFEPPSSPQPSNISQNLPHQDPKWSLNAFDTDTKCGDGVVFNPKPIQSLKAPSSLLEELSSMTSSAPITWPSSSADDSTHSDNNFETTAMLRMVQSNVFTAQPQPGDSFERVTETRLENPKTPVVPSLSLLGRSMPQQQKTVAAIDVLSSLDSDRGVSLESEHNDSTYGLQQPSSMSSIASTGDLTRPQWTDTALDVKNCQQELPRVSETFDSPREDFRKESPSIIDTSSQKSESPTFASPEVVTAPTPTSEARSIKESDGGFDLPKLVNLPSASRNSHEDHLRDGSAKRNKAGHPESPLLNGPNLLQNLQILRTSIDALPTTHLIPLSTPNVLQLDYSPIHRSPYTPGIESPSLPPADPVCKTTRRRPSPRQSNTLTPLCKSIDGKRRAHRLKHPGIIDPELSGPQDASNIECPVTGHTPRPVRKRARSDLPEERKESLELARSQRSHSVATSRHKQSGSRRRTHLPADGLQNVVEDSLERDSPRHKGVKEKQETVAEAHPSSKVSAEARAPSSRSPRSKQPKRSKTPPLATKRLVSKKNHLRDSSLLTPREFVEDDPHQSGQSPVSDNGRHPSLCTPCGTHPRSKPPGHCKSGQRVSRERLSKSQPRRKERMSDDSLPKSVSHRQSVASESPTTPRLMTQPEDISIFHTQQCHTGLANGLEDSPRNSNRVSEMQCKPGTISPTVSDKGSLSNQKIQRKKFVRPQSRSTKTSVREPKQSAKIALHQPAIPSEVSSGTLLLLGGEKTVCGSPRVWDSKEFSESTFRVNSTESLDSLTRVTSSKNGSSKTTSLVDGIQVRPGGITNSLPWKPSLRPPMNPTVRQSPLANDFPVIRNPVNNSTSPSKATSPSINQQPLTPPYRPSQPQIDAPVSRLPKVNPAPTTFPVSPLSNSLLSSSRNCKSTPSQYSFNTDDSKRFTSPDPLPSNNLTPTSFNGYQGASSTTGNDSVRYIRPFSSNSPTPPPSSRGLGASPPSQKLSPPQQHPNLLIHPSVQATTTTSLRHSKESINDPRMDGLAAMSRNMPHTLQDSGVDPKRIEPPVSVPRVISSTPLRDYRRPSTQVVTPGATHPMLTHPPGGPSENSQISPTKIPRLERSTAPQNTQIVHRVIPAVHSPTSDQSPSTMQHTSVSNGTITQSENNPVQQQGNGVPITKQESSASVRHVLAESPLVLGVQTGVTTSRASAPSPALTAEPRFDDEESRFKTPIRERNSISRNASSNTLLVGATVPSPNSHQTDCTSSHPQPPTTSAPPSASTSQPWTVPRAVVPAPSWVNKTYDGILRPSTGSTTAPIKTAAQTSPLVRNGTGRSGDNPSPPYDDHSPSSKTDQLSSHHQHHYDSPSRPHHHSQSRSTRDGIMTRSNSTRHLQAPSSIPLSHFFPPSEVSNSRANHRIPTSPVRPRPHHHHHKHHKSQQDNKATVALVSLQGHKPPTPNKPEQPNQDSAFVLKLGPNLIALAVFDGHGEYGHEVSDFACESFKGLLGEEFGSESSPKDSQVLQSERKLFSWMKSAFKKVDKRLTKRHPMINLLYSGSTGSLALCHNDIVYVGFVGDSKVVGYLFKGNSPVKILQTTEHNPSAPRELQRVRRAGGQVSEMFFPHLNKTVSRIVEAGISVSRAFGDLEARKFGLVCEPEFMRFEMIGCDNGPHETQTSAENQRSGNSQYCRMLLVLASDGLWDTVSGEDLLRYIGNERRSRDALTMSAKEITKLAWQQRLRAEGRSDDTTAILALFA